MTVVRDLLCSVFRNGHRIAGADEKGRSIADPYQPMTGLDDTPFEDRQLM
jgi:hypothetical protein